MKGTHFTEPAKGGSIKRQVVNPDLQEERDKKNFDIDDVLAVCSIEQVRMHQEKFQFAKDIEERKEL
jgi:hypothetical protein